MRETFAIVDVETTGTSAAYHRIIEIAIVRVERGKVVRRFSTLVDPERYVSPVIEQITGIRNADLEGAPRFAAIAQEVHRLLDGAVFVAHNARFDYSFVKEEFARLGRRFSARCLCTVKLSRALHPEHRRHDLSSVIERHAIKCTQRHRAMGDVLAVHSFLELMREEVGEKSWEAVVARLLRTRTLPAQMDRGAVDDLPSGSGVYLFYGSGGELLYVGKSLNVRDRVLDHFGSDREQGLCQQVVRVEARETAGELGALLLELQLIKTLHPVYNQASRSTKPLVVAWREITRDGYYRLAMTSGEPVPPAESHRVMAVFKFRSQANRFLQLAAREFRLCHKFLGLDASRGACFQYQLHRCPGTCVGEDPPDFHNRRFEQAFARRRVHAWPFRGAIAITERAPGDAGGDVFLVDQWCLLSGHRVTEMGQHPLFMAGPWFDYDSYKVLAAYVRNPRHRRTIREISREQLAMMENDV
jgi:DNA polymerase-3 subunit epsilon